MRKTIVKLVTTVLFASLLAISQPLTTVAAVTVGDLVGDTTADNMQDPVKLINLALLKGVDITTIKYLDKTIVDVLTTDEKDSYAFSDTTILVYTEALNNARNGVKNGWSVDNIMKYSDEAYRLYNDKIATLATTEVTTDTINTAISNYIKDHTESNVDVGDLKEQLPVIASDYSLKSIVITENSNKIKVSTDLGAIALDDVPLECVKTVWYTNGMPMKAFFNGTVTEITPTSLSTSIGGEQHKLTITYKSEKNIVLLDENIDVGQYVTQGVDILGGLDTTFEITVQYNDENIDFLSLLGPTGKILINEYKRLQAEAYDANRDTYIEKYLKSHVN